MSIGLLKRYRLDPFGEDFLVFLASGKANPRVVFEVKESASESRRPLEASRYQDPQRNAFWWVLCT